MTDQQRGDSVPPFGRAKLPFVERLAREGVVFSQAFCPSPHCCPSRATFFSGLYPSEHGVWNNVENGTALSPGLYDGVRLWSEDLRAAGYDLQFSGKWHVSRLEGPQHRGWQTTRCVPPVSSQAAFRHQPLPKRDWNVHHTPPAPGVTRHGHIRRPGYAPFYLYGECDDLSGDRQTVDDALAHIRGREYSRRPWCRYVGVTGPHDPYFVPQRFLDLYDMDEIELPANFSDRMQDKPALYRKNRDRFDQLSETQQREALHHYLALCSYEDALFGEVLDALEESGELDNTVIIYTSDHGDYASEHGLWTKGLACFRGAYHVPLIVRWPRGIKHPGRVVDEFVTLADIAPTLLELAGTVSPQKLSGRSLLPFLRGEGVCDWRDAVFTQSNGNEIYGIQRSVMTRDWKFVYNTFDYDELYDLRNDPGETRNLAREAQHQGVIRELSRRLWRFAEEHGDTHVGFYIFTGLAQHGPGILFEEESIAP